MPLDKNMSHEDMVAELISGYKKTGKIGATKPRDMKHALEIANAVAYNIEESKEVKKIYKEVKEMKLEELLKSLECIVSSKEKELGIMNETSVKVEFDNGETIETEVSKDATDDDIKDYYAVGKEFNLGQGGRDRMAKVKNVSVTRNVGESFEDVAKTYGIDPAEFNKNHKFSDYDEIPEEWEEFIEDSNATFSEVCALFDKKGYFIEKLDPIETGYITFKVYSPKKKSTGVMEISRAEIVSNNMYDIAQRIADETYERYPNIHECMQFLPVEMEFSDDSEENCCCEDAIDVIALDIPLLIRLLEWSREDAKDDVDLHVVAENIIKIMKNNTEFLTMDDYSAIVPQGQEIVDLTGNEENPPMEEMDMGDMGTDPVQPMKSKRLKRKNKRK